MKSRDARECIGITEDAMSFVASLSKELSRAHERELVEMSEKAYLVLDDIRALLRRYEA